MEVRRDPCLLLGKSLPFSGNITRESSISNKTVYLLFWVHGAKVFDGDFDLFSVTSTDSTTTCESRFIDFLVLLFSF